MAMTTPRSRLERWTEVAGNIVFVVVAVVLCAYILVHWAGRTAKTDAVAAFPVGQPLPVMPGVEYADARLNVLLVLNSECRFCTDSVPFYRRLAGTARRPKARVIAAGMQPEAELRRYLAQHDVAVDKIVELQPAMLSVRGTPTVIAADEHGLVKASWIGVLSRADENALLEMMR